MKGTSQKTLKSVWKEVEAGKTVKLVCDSSVKKLNLITIKPDTFKNESQFENNVKWLTNCERTDFANMKKWYGRTGKFSVWFEIQPTENFNLKLEKGI